MIAIEIPLPRVAVSKALVPVLLQYKTYALLGDEEVYIILNGHDTDITTEVFITYLYKELKAFPNVKKIISHQGPSIIKETVDELNKQMGIENSFSAVEISDLTDVLRRNMNKDVESVGSYSSTIFTVKDLSSLALALLNEGYKKQ